MPVKTVKASKVTKYVQQHTTEVVTRSQRRKPRHTQGLSDVGIAHSSSAKKNTKTTVKKKKVTKTTRAAASTTKASRLPVNALKLLLEEVGGVLHARRRKQIEHAEKKNFTYDPRAPVQTIPTLHDLCLIGLGKDIFDELVNSFSTRFCPMLSRLDEEEGEEVDETTPFQDYCCEVFMEVEGCKYFFDAMEAVVAFGINRLFQLVPASYCLGLLAAGETPPATKEDIKALLTARLDLNQLVEVHPLTPYFADVKPIENATEEDPQDEEADWSDKFNNHMLWLFDRFQEQNCTSIGRIHKAFGAENLDLMVDDKDELLSQAFGEAVFSQMGGAYWQKLAQCNDEDPDFNGHDFIKKQCILLHAIQSAPMDYRTYTGTFCFNVRESDYDGCRTGILEYVADDATTFFNPFEFIVAETLGYDVEDVIDNIVTEAFYIPGKNWGRVEDESEGEDQKIPGEDWDRVEDAGEWEDQKIPGEDWERVGDESEGEDQNNGWCLIS